MDCLIKQNDQLFGCNCGFTEFWKCLSKEPFVYVRLNYNGGLNATEFEAQMSNYILLFYSYVFTYPRLNPDAGLTSVGKRCASTE